MMRKSILLAASLALIVVACSAPVGGDDVPSSRGSPGLDPADAGLRVSTAGWSTDFGQHSVPLGEIISGGPGKDGIPSIDFPRLEDASAIDWLEPQEPVIAFGIGEDWRAYPIQILVWHEIVNDTFGNTPVTITFCPLCHTAIVFDDRVGDLVLDFGTTGNLRHSDLVMYDRQTESWWQQATGQAIVGELTGTELTFLPSQLVSWQAFRDAHPDGRVLSRDTGFDRPYGSNPYAGYDTVDSVPFLLDDRTLLDGRLSPKVRVLGLVIEDASVAYPFPLLAEHPVINDVVADTPVVVVWADGTASGLGASTVAGGEDVGAANAFSREVDGRTLTFEPAGDGVLRDRETGSTWAFGGLATAGELEGSQLELLVADAPFWFAWAIFRPDTRIWQPEDG